MPGICLITPLDILTFRPPLGALRATSTCQQCLISSYSPHAEPLPGHPGPHLVQLPRRVPHKVNRCSRLQPMWLFHASCMTQSAQFQHSFSTVSAQFQHSFSTVSAQFQQFYVAIMFFWPASATAFAQSRPKLPVVSPQEISHDKKRSHISVEHLHSSPTKKSWKN